MSGDPYIFIGLCQVLILSSSSVGVPDNRSFCVCAGCFLFFILVILVIPPIPPFALLATGICSGFYCLDHQHGSCIALYYFLSIVLADGLI